MVGVGCGRCGRAGGGWGVRVGIAVGIGMHCKLMNVVDRGVVEVVMMHWGELRGDGRWNIVRNGRFGRPEVGHKVESAGVDERRGGHDVRGVGGEGEGCGGWVGSGERGVRDGVVEHWAGWGMIPLSGVCRDEVFDGVHDGWGGCRNEGNGRWCVREDLGVGRIARIL